MLGQFGHHLLHLLAKLGAHLVLAEGEILPRLPLGVLELAIPVTNIVGEALGLLGTHEGGIPVQARL